MKIEVFYVKIWIRIHIRFKNYFAFEGLDNSVRDYWLNVYSFQYLIMRTEIRYVSTEEAGGQTDEKRMERCA